MSTRASAPRCASCGMPLAPDAESCAVCGARVPLIARPASGDDDAPAEALAPANVATSVLSPPPASVDPGPTGPAGPTGPVSARGTLFDPAAAARDVRAAARPASAPPASAPPAPARPAPAGPSRPTVDAPPVSTRVLAYAIDLLAVAVVAVLGALVAGLVDVDVAPVTGLLVLVVAIAQLVAEGVHGATLGAHLLRLRTVDARTGASPGVPRAFVRQLVVGLGVLAFGVGNWVVAASGAWDRGPQRRGWHDRASGTAVVQGGDARSTSGQGRGSTAQRPRRAGSPWTPSAPSPVPVGTATGARATAAPSGGPFAPPVQVETSSIVLPPPPSVVPAQAVPATPDLLPAAPAGAAAPAAVAPPEADLLPAPPEVSRRTRGAARPARSTDLAEEPVAALQRPDEELAELEHTRVRDPESLRRPSGTLALLFDTGERVRVVGRGLVGRGPRAEDGQDILHVVVLSDAARSLSRVHVEFGPLGATTDEDSAIWVSDRGSTNGTVVVDPSGAARVLPAGTRAVVRAGWTVRLGDREARVEDD